MAKKFSNTKGNGTADKRGRSNNYQNGKGSSKRPRGGSKSGKNFGRNDRSDDQRDIGPDNDISWYTRNPNLLEAAAKFPFPNRPGMKVRLDNLAGTDKWEYDIPGIMTMDWIPSLGYSEGPTDPASILGNEIYARVRKVYSGTLRADAPDYPIYIMALDSVFAYIAWLKRIYRVLNAYTPENYILPDVVLESMGLKDASILQLRRNKEELWGNINTLVNMSRRFTCPGSIDVINRHYWMSDNVYTDAMSINSQFYMFNPKGFFQYGTKKDTSGVDVPSLIFKPLPFVDKPMAGSFSPSTAYTYGKELIDALTAWDDSYTINGYLRRAYEGENFFTVDEIPHDAVFEPVYSPEVLHQIENSMSLPGFRDVTFAADSGLYDFDITQDVPTNSIISKPSYVADTTDKNTGASYYMNPFLTSRLPAPDVVDNTIGTRLKNYIRSTKAVTGGTQYFIGCATEIVVGWRIWLTHLTNDNYVANMKAYIPQVYMLDTPTTLDDAKVKIQDLIDMTRMCPFDWHPLMFLVNSTGLTEVVGDIHNVTTISKGDLGKLHRVCLFSEFNSFGMQ